MFKRLENLHYKTVNGLEGSGHDNVGRYRSGEEVMVQLGVQRRNRRSFNLETMYRRGGRG